MVELDLEVSDGKGTQDLGSHAQHLGVGHHEPCVCTPREKKTLGGLERPVRGARHLPLGVCRGCRYVTTCIAPGTSNRSIGSFKARVPLLQRRTVW